MRYLYVDYAATTPVNKKVIKAILPYFSKNFGNPSSSHAYGTKVKEILTKSRMKVADFLNCSPEEVIFTSGGTESENLAIKGIAFSNKKFGKHIIISSVEHVSVDSSASFLEKQGFQVSRIPVNHDCMVDVAILESAIREDTILISVMYVNNEIGTIQPIQQISEMLKRVNLEREKLNKNRILLHTDGEAGSVYMDYDVNKLGVDSLSVNGSKIYGLKGASALYVKNGVGVSTQICGGGQESMIRGGTENVPAIVALAEALSIAKITRIENVKKVLAIKNKLITSLSIKIKGVRINTPLDSVPNIVHVTFLDNTIVDIIVELNTLGLCVSNGAACASNKDKKSQVLEAMGFNESEMNMSVRFSFGVPSKKSDVSRIIKILSKVLSK